MSRRVVPRPVVPLILAAGAASRFGSPKALALLEGRSLIAHVLGALAGLDLAPPVVVVGAAGEAIRAAVVDASVSDAAVGDAATRWVTNPDPSAGLSNSLRLGVAEIASRSPEAEAILILLGDQPLVRSAVVRSLLRAVPIPGSVAVAPRYAGGGGANPLLLLRAGWPLAARATGDRGLGPLLRDAVITWVDVEGDNPDVDTPADLAALAETAWGRRVIENREQVDRVREVPDGPDFYGPVSAMFVADPRRMDDPVLDALLSIAAPGETWLDIGAGAGRFALPIALAVGPDGSVIAIDASPSMLEGLRAGMVEHGIPNIRVIEGRWPLENAAGAAAAADGMRAEDLLADVAFIAHVGYDIEAIGPFLTAMEAVARSRCVAVLMEQTPAAVVGPFWPIVHGEERIQLPALPEFLGILAAHGRDASVRRIELGRRSYPSRDQIAALVRRQLWVEPGSPKDQLAMAHLDAVLESVDDGVELGDADPLVVGIVEWDPRSM